MPAANPHWSKPAGQGAQPAGSMPATATLPTWRLPWQVRPPAGRLFPLSSDWQSTSDCCVDTAIISTVVDLRPSPSSRRPRSGRPALEAVTTNPRPTDETVSARHFASEPTPPAVPASAPGLSRPYPRPARPATDEP